MKRFRNLLKGLSLTGSLFVFQACYGTPAAPPVQEELDVLVQDTEEEVPASDLQLEQHAADIVPAGTGD